MASASHSDKSAWEEYLPPPLVVWREERCSQNVWGTLTKWKPFAFRSIFPTFHFPIKSESFLEMGWGSERLGFFPPLPSFTPGAFPLLSQDPILLSSSLTLCLCVCQKMADSLKHLGNLLSFPHPSLKESFFPALISSPL